MGLKVWGFYHLVCILHTPIPNCKWVTMPSPQCKVFQTTKFANINFPIKLLSHNTVMRQYLNTKYCTYKKIPHTYIVWFHQFLYILSRFEIGLFQEACLLTKYIYREHTWLQVFHIFVDSLHDHTNIFFKLPMFFTHKGTVNGSKFPCLGTDDDFRWTWPQVTLTMAG